MHISSLVTATLWVKKTEIPNIELTMHHFSKKFRSKSLKAPSENMVVAEAICMPLLSYVDNSADHLTVPFPVVPRVILPNPLPLTASGVSHRGYKCRFCSFVAKQRGNLVSHERCHTGERPFQCRYCPYATAQQGSLNLHERIHTGERPHKCRWCNYASGRKETVKIHERRHTGEKPYKCSSCSYATSQRWNLKLHQKRHERESVWCTYPSRAWFTLLCSLACIWVRKLAVVTTVVCTAFHKLA